MIEGIRRNGITLAWFAIMTACAGGFVWSQTSPVHSSVSVQATQATLTIALWESKSYLIRTTPGHPPSFDPVTIAYVQLGTDGPVPPPPPPPPSTLTVRAKAIREAALKAVADPARFETAQKLAIFYEQLGIKIKAGEIKGLDQITAITKAGADMILVGNGDAWKPFRDTLTAQATALAQEGGDDAGYVKLFEDVRSGLMSTVPQQELRSVGAPDWEKWLKIILEILAIVMKLYPAEAFQ